MYAFSNILIDNIYTHLGWHLLQMYSLVSGLREDGIRGRKQVGGASQYIYIYVCVCVCVCVCLCVCVCVCV